MCTHSGYTVWTLIQKRNIMVNTCLVDSRGRNHSMWLKPFWQKDATLTGCHCDGVARKIHSLLTVGGEGEDLRECSVSNVTSPNHLVNVVKSVADTRKNSKSATPVQKNLNSPVTGESENMPESTESHENRLTLSHHIVESQRQSKRTSQILHHL
ncbi:uncharacterized protein LOC144441890 [Glandiceps talaboti]